MIIMVNGFMLSVVRVSVVVLRVVTVSVIMLGLGCSEFCYAECCHYV